MNLHIHLVSISRFLCKTKNDHFLEHILLLMQVVHGLHLPSNYSEHEDEALTLLCYRYEIKGKWSTYDLMDFLLYKLLPNPNYLSGREPDSLPYMLWRRRHLRLATEESLSELEHWKITID